MKNQTEVEHRIKIFESMLFDETCMRSCMTSPKDAKRIKKSDIAINRLDSIIENLKWVLK